MRPGAGPAGAHAYLARIDVDPGLPPTLETLRRVHRAHLDAVPYENLGIMLANLLGGTPPSTAVEDCLRRVATVGRAGYCFHQNTALGAGLEALGFDVSHRHGHVWTRPEHRGGAELNHLVLVVSGLPTGENPGGRWWPDAGLGEGFRDPVALVDGPFEDGGFGHALDGVTPDGWSFTHASGGTFRGIEVTPRPVDDDGIASAHAELSTPPDGVFTRVLVVQRRRDTHYDSLRGCVLSRVGGSSRVERDVTSYTDWRNALVTVLRVPVDDVPADDLEALWSSVRGAHDAWDAAGRP
ncbi:arylamine N-acetyltransferase [Nocardioides sp.]|uniref:arylamine N-acetyltransferase family protein n=1 Tax=Nocardioides sp. TaxID=35761 RepID=UPI001A28F924|nr:arylamine N-acetyltransferase [Nocardioides sp.]MBJ7356222.1 arylamine N-acetyltransferase [Nocardioides sp.]